jgi:hypothetical protein
MPVSVKLSRNPVHIIQAKMAEWPLVQVKIFFAPKPKLTYAKSVVLQFPEL